MEREKKRDRSVNFTCEETERLVSLVEAKKIIIESKKSDAITWRGKETAWKEIETSFNSFNGGVYRNAKNLKLKYESLKRDIRKKIAIARDQLHKTDDSTRVVSPLTPVEEKVKEMILLSVEGDGRIYYSDHTKDTTNILSQIQSTTNITIEDEPLPKKICEEPIKQQKSNDEPIQKEADPTILSSTSSLGTQQNHASKNKRKAWNLSSLKSRKLATLCIPKEKRALDKLAETKVEIALLQKQLVEEEIQQKQIQKKICQEELEFKRHMNELEKEHLLLKIELLKTELQDAKARKK